ncbi:MAG TPA: hypothetical protein VGH33_20240 [Isosphaeraceae bacterium]
MIGMHSGLMLAAVLTTGGGRPADSIATIAGSYHFYDGRPSPRFRLDVTAEGRFAVYSLNLAVIEENRGGAEVRDGRLILTPERPHKDLKEIGFRTKLTPVRWGERLVLVPEGREQAFCNVVNLGLPAQSLRWVAYIRKNDEWIDDMIFDRPDVPPGWSSMLLKTPLQGRVVEVLADHRARVDFGSDRGAMNGLAVWADLEAASSIGKGGWACTVVEVSPNECVIKIDPPIYSTLHFEAGKRVQTRHILADLAESLQRKAPAASKASRTPNP